MSAFDKLQHAWLDVERRFMSSPPLRRAIAGDVSAAHYAAYLRETYFYTREDPQIQAAATLYLRGADREMVGPFLQHARSEVGHDQLALNDLAALGYDVSSIPSEDCLPATALLFSYPMAAMAHRSPVAYLGYLFFLEFLPTSQGESIAGVAARAGVPREAMSFLIEHREVDVHHNRLMKVYADHMIRSDNDLASAIFAMQATGIAFVGMLENAFESVDVGTTQLRPSDARALAR